MKKTIYIIILLLFSYSCALHKLEMQRTDFTSGEFQTHGFYYSKPSISNYYSPSFYVFYKNGVFINSGYENSINDITQFLNNKESVNMLRELPYYWGVFQVRNDSIYIEKWISTDAFGAYPTVKYIGKVLDHEKIAMKIPKIKSTIKPAKDFKLDTLYFYPFELKPDSANNFIRN